MIFVAEFSQQQNLFKTVVSDPHVSVSMSSEVQPRPDDSPNTSGGSSDAEQREAAPPEQPGPEQRDQTQPKKKEAKISSKTAAKLSTSAKR